MSIISAVLAALILLYAPGRTWIRPALRSAPREFRTRLLLEVLLATSLTSWVGFLLVEARLYSLPLLLVLLAGIGAVGWFINRRHTTATHGLGGRAGLASLVLALIWVSPPLDTRLLSGDSSGYLASGIQVARTGGLIIADPTIQMLDVDTRRSLFPSVAADRGSPPYLRLQGSMVLRSLDSDEVLPAFHHMLSLWLAICGDLTGEERIEWVITLFAGLSIWAIFLLAYQIGGSWAAWPTVIVLLVQAPQYWYSRFLMPEVPAQFFLWGGIAALLACERSRIPSKVPWIAAGVSLGIAGMMRLENLAFLAIAIGLASIIGLWKRRSSFWALGAATIVGGHSVLHTACFRTHYWGNLSNLLMEDGARFAMLVLGGLSMLIIAARLRPRLANSDSLQPAMISLLLLVSLYVDSQQAFEGSKLLIGYCGVPFVVLGGIGAAWLLVAAGTGTGVPLLILLGTLGLMQFLAAPHATPVPIWAIRRAVPLVIPLLGIGTGFLIAALAGRGRPTRLIAGLLLTLTVATSLRVTGTLRGTPFYAGSTHHLNVLSTLIQPDSVVLIDPRITAYGFASQLWVTGARVAYLIADNDSRHLAILASTFTDRPLYWVGDGHAPIPVASRIHLQPVALYQFVLATPKLEVGSASAEIAHTESSLSLYRVFTAP